MVCHLDNNIFARDVINKNTILHEHIYNTKHPIFYFCRTHAHFHKAHPEIECIIHEFKCCDAAVSVKDFNECFIITTFTRKANSITKNHDWIIFDPTIWREQSYNHFMSLIRAAIISPNDVPERYARFESSNFTISNIRPYISGKESIIRTSITGFETNGIYQTSTISCTIPYYSVVLPQKIYDGLESDGYDLSLVMVKRDPSIWQMCMYVCSAVRNPDPRCLTTTISDQQSKGLNQDQDGDKNAIYFNLKRVNGYDCTKSYDYKLSKIELASAFRAKRTLIGTPRYILSETSMLKIKRCPQDFMHLDFFKKTFADGVGFMNEASAGYLCNEYDEFQDALRQHAINEIPKYITVDDILLKTDRLETIVSSGAKGSVDLIELLLKNISSAEDAPTLTSKKKEMLELCNKYITSSQELSSTGRKQFASLFAAQDLVVLFSLIYINKVCYADFGDFASAATFLFNKASLQLFIRDLKEL